jgi:hypothetical protein
MRQGLVNILIFTAVALAAIVLSIALGGAGGI